MEYSRFSLQKVCFSPVRAGLFIDSAKNSVSDSLVSSDHLLWIIDDVDLYRPSELIIVSKTDPSGNSILFSDSQVAPTKRVEVFSIPPVEFLRSLLGRPACYYSQIFQYPF